MPEAPLPQDGLDARGPAATRRGWVLAACLLATFISAVESTIVATAVPTIVASLEGFELFGWVFAIYFLTQAVGIPVYGRLADHYGRRPVFVAGTGLFLAGSLGCGFAGSMVALILCRGLQGLGAGAVQPIAATILGDLYAPEERAKVQGLVAAVYGIAALAGPSLGAFLIDLFDWQSVFWINVPIGLAAIALIAVSLKEHAVSPAHPVDWIGSVLLLLCGGALMVVCMQDALLTPLELGAVLMLGLATLAVLIWHERGVPEPMLAFELWRQRVIAVGSLGSGFCGALLMGVAAFLPTYVQGVMGRGPVASGAVLGAMSVGWSAASFATAPLMRTRSFRGIAVFGGLCMLVGAGLLVAMSPTARLWWPGLASLVMGVGMGLCTTIFIVAVQGSVAWNQRGAATSTLMCLRVVGQSLGVVLCAGALNASIAATDPGAADSALDRLLDRTGRASLAPEELADLTDVVARGLHDTHLLATAFAAASLVAALILPRGLRATPKPARTRV
ncbi:MAG: MFS transporter [Rhodospirillales bacterium]|nr:MFS transporter [Rhodospirillales bacterium]